MSVIHVPGAELERVHELLRRTKELMDGTAVRSMGSVVDTLGQRNLEDAAHQFEKRWGDGGTSWPRTSKAYATPPRRSPTPSGRPTRRR